MLNKNDHCKPTDFYSKSYARVQKDSNIVKSIHSLLCLEYNTEFSRCSKEFENEVHKKGIFYRVKNLWKNTES